MSNLLRLLWKHRLIGAGVCLPVLLMLPVLAAARAPTYRARAFLIVSWQRPSVDDTDPLAVCLTSWMPETPRMRAQVIESRRFVERAYEHCGMAVAREQERRPVRAVVHDESNVIEVWVQGRDPEGVARLANALVDLYVLDVGLATYRGLRQTTLLVEEELQKARERVRAAERGLRRTGIRERSARIRERDLARTGLKKLREILHDLKIRLQASSAPDARVLEHASVPIFPMSPTSPRDLLLAAVLAIALGTLAASAAERTARPLTSREVGALPGRVRVLGLLARCDATGHDVPSPPAAGGYDLLRSNLTLANWDAAVQHLRVVDLSPVDRRGSVARYFVTSLALGGKRVLLVSSAPVAGVRDPLGQAGRWADAVIVGAQSTQGQEIAEIAYGVVVVVQDEETPPKELARVLGRARRAGMPILGVVFDGVEPNWAEYCWRFYYRNHRWPGGRERLS